MFQDLIKGIYTQHIDSSDGSYLALVEGYITEHAQKSDIVSYQWLEAWMDSTVSNPVLSDQGVYYFPMHKERFYEAYCEAMTGHITEQIKAHGYDDIGDVLALIEPQEHSNLSDIEFAYAKEFYSIVSEEPDELLNFLMFCFCRANSIDTSSIDTNLNGQYSIMAAAHNERVALYTAIYDILTGKRIEPAAAATITSNWGPCILHLFSENDIERRRAERELTRKVTIPL